MQLARQSTSSNLAAWDKDGDGDIDADDMKLLDRNDARRFYHQHFWYPQLDQLASPINAIKLFDMGVNMGKRQAGRVFQRSLLFVDPKLTVDGLVGPKTLATEHSTVKNGYFGRHLEALTAANAKFYFDLADAAPVTRGMFLIGWLRRAYALPA